MNTKTAQQVGAKKLQLRVNPVTSATGQQPTPGSSKNKSKAIAVAKVQQNSNTGGGGGGTNNTHQGADLLTRPNLTLNSTKNKNSQREWQALLMQQKARSTKNNKKDGEKGEKLTAQGLTSQVKKNSFFTGNIQIAPVQRAISNDHAPEIRAGNIQYKEGGSADVRIFTCAMANKQRSQNQTVQHQQLKISKKSPTARITGSVATQQLLLNQKATKTISPVNIAAQQDSGDECDGKKSKKVIEVINIRKRYGADSSVWPETTKQTTLRKGLHNQQQVAQDAVLSLATAVKKQRTLSDGRIKQKVPGPAKQPQTVVTSAAGKCTTVRSKGSSNHSATQKGSLQQHAPNLRTRLASKSNEKSLDQTRSTGTTARQTSRGRVNTGQNTNGSGGEIPRQKPSSTRVKKQAMQLFAQGKGNKVTKNLYQQDGETSQSPQKLSNSSTSNLNNKSFQFHTAQHPVVNSDEDGTVRIGGPQIKIKTTHNTQTYQAQPSMPYTCSAAEEKAIFFQATVDKGKEPGLLIQKVKTVRQQKIKDLKTKRVFESSSGQRTGAGVSPKQISKQQALAVLQIAQPSVDIKKLKTIPFSTQNICLVNEQANRDCSKEQSLENAKQVVKRPKKFNFGSLKNVEQIPEDEGDRIRNNQLTSSQERKSAKFKAVAESKNSHSNVSISGTRKSISAKKTTLQKQVKKVMKAQDELSYSVQKSTSKILLEDTRPVQNVGREMLTTKECYTVGFLATEEQTQSTDEAPSNQQDGVPPKASEEADASFDMARFRMHYNRGFGIRASDSAASLVLAPKKLQTKKTVRQQQPTSTSTEIKSKVEKKREDEQQSLAAIVSKLKMQGDKEKNTNRGSGSGTVNYTQQHSSPQNTSHQESQGSYKVKKGSTSNQVAQKMNNLSSSDFADDSFTFLSLKNLQAKLDEHDLSGYAASTSANGNYQVKTQAKRSEVVVQKLNGELLQRDTDIKKLIGELQNRDTVIHSLKEEMGLLVDQIKQGEQKREKSKERIKSLICKVESKLQKFTHLTDLNNNQLQQLRQYDDSSRKNTESEEKDKIQEAAIIKSAATPVTIKLKNIRQTHPRQRENKTPTIVPAAQKSSFVSGVLLRLGDSKDAEAQEKQLDLLLAAKSQQNNRALTQINIGHSIGLGAQPQLKHSIAISKLKLQGLNVPPHHSNSCNDESPMTIANFTESVLTMPMGTLASSNSQYQISTGGYNSSIGAVQAQDSFECSLVTVADESFTIDESIRQVIGKKKSNQQSNKDGMYIQQMASFDNRCEEIHSTDLSLIQLEHEWERAQRDLAKQSEQVRKLLLPLDSQQPATNNFFKQSVDADKGKVAPPQMRLQLDKLSRTEKIIDLNKINEADDCSDYDQVSNGMHATFYLGEGKVTSRFGGQHDADEEAAVVSAGKPTAKEGSTIFSKTMSKGSLQKRIQIEKPQKLQVDKDPAQCYGLKDIGYQVKTTTRKHKLITRSKEWSGERSFDHAGHNKSAKREITNQDDRPKVIRQSKSPNDPGTTKLLIVQKSFDQALKQEEHSPRQIRSHFYREQGQGNQIVAITGSSTGTELPEKQRDTSALKKQMLMMAALKAQNQRQQNVKQGHTKEGDSQKDKSGQTKLRLHVLKTNANGSSSTAQTVKNSQNVVKMTRQLVDESAVKTTITGGKNTPTSRKSKHIIN